jgi:two-component system, NtrC family, sensor kinase
VEGEMMVLAVADNGPGIDPDHLPRLFDPFFTTKAVGEGTGLGLSICHGIVTGHGGRIEVRSRPACGTTFRVYLPLTHSSGERVEIQKTGPEETSLGFVTPSDPLESQRE